MVLYVFERNYCSDSERSEHEGRSDRGLSLLVVRVSLTQLCSVMASGDHKHIKTQASDTVVLSSTPILSRVTMRWLAIWSTTLCARACMSIGMKREISMAVVLYTCLVMPASMNTKK